MISDYFIRRPIAANVIAIITMILGVVALQVLPVERYPNITPPTIQVTATYPGANAQVVTDTVAAPLEQQVNGVENMLYMSSTSSSNGTYSLTVTFNVGTDLDAAQVLVQNRVSLAEPLLPTDVRQLGISVKKQSTSILLVASLTSPDKSFDSLYLSNYASLRLRDELSRVEGVGDVNVSGSGAYSMRIWVDPTRLDARELTFQDLLTQLRQQNVQVAAGTIGQPPMGSAGDFQLTVTALGRLSTPEEFENIIIKFGDEGSLTYLRDVARVELGAQSYDTFAQRGGIDSASVLIYQLPGANALAVADRVRAAMEKLKQSFPEGMEYDIPFDITEFVSAAIHEVYKTLLEAGVLVLVVILVFLQDWRAVLIPATTVPVTIIGAFAVMPLIGFSINLLTLFGIVLAIGIVVDDAIVIVENATHHVEQGKTPIEAAELAMSEVTGPIIGITAVLMAVFIPTTFLSGVTGQLYRQFALTIAATALISAINALTLKPAQCAQWLKPPTGKKKFIFARWFNTIFSWIENAYVAIVRVLLRGWHVSLVVFGITVGLTAWWYTLLPTGFLPTEDQGYLITAVQLPDAASQERTKEVIDQMNKILSDVPGVETWFTLGGLSLLEGSQSSNAATVFVRLQPWEKRTTAQLQQPALIQTLMQRFGAIKEAFILVIAPPAIQGLGVSGGFEMEVQDRGAGREQMQAAVQRMIELAAAKPELSRVSTSFRPGVPQLFADVDRQKVLSMRVALGDVFGTLQAALGSAYVNDFNKFGRTYRVTLQADSPYRNSVDSIRRLKVRNVEGQMVSLQSLVNMKDAYGPQIIRRFNLYPSATITGSASPGSSSGDALKTMSSMADEVLSDSLGFEWSGVSRQESDTSGGEYAIFALSVLLVYLVLAFLYESWLLPFSVILVVPLGILGTVAFVWFLGIENNVYVQIGIVLIIALASKNAILIVEFAHELRKKGQSIRDAAVEASRLRFRPILMTSFAFILGVLPLVFAEGAAAASRRSLGAAVCGGMLTSTILAVFFTPVFFVVFQWLSEWFTRKPVSSTPVATK